MIGIDASRAFLGPRTGTETYTLELLRALSELEFEDRIELYLNSKKPPAGLPELGAPICMPFPRLWTHLRLSARMARHPPDVLFVPAHVVPIVHPKSVVTIHDVGYLVRPEDHSPRQRRMLELTTRWSLNAARRVLAVSATTRDDLVRSYGIDPSKIDIVYHGVSPRFRNIAKDAVDETRAKLNLHGPYVLFVGTIQPRKNLPALVEAMARLSKDERPRQLVIAGKPGWNHDVVQADIARRRGECAIHEIGYVSDQDLPALYAGADAFCLPSFYEGFGMPVLEAMAAGTPVIASNRGALPEITGNAGLIVDPEDSAAFARSLERVLADTGLRTDLIARGRKRAASFTWQQSAELTLACLRSVRDE